MSVDLEGKAFEGMTWGMWSESDYYDLFMEEINNKISDLMQVRAARDIAGVFYINSGSVTENEYNCIATIIEGYTGNAQTVTHSQVPSSMNESDVIQANHNYSICAFGNAECVFPDSEILNDLSGKTTLAKDIKENDDIAYYNFEKETIEIGKVSKVYIHKKATNFVRYTFEDGSYLEATDYHPIYTKEGWKSYTNRNGYEKPKVNDEIKTQNGWKKLTKIEEFKGIEDCYDFVIKKQDGKIINNYFANGTLVQGSY